MKTKHLFENAPILTVVLKLFHEPTNLPLSLSLSLSLGLVPAPSVVITETATPFNGAEFSLSCSVTVDQSVDTPVNISTHWLLPHYTDTPNTISSNITERISELQQLHNLIFRPLHSQDSGSYSCTATIISSESDHFVKDNTALKTTYLTVQGKLVLFKECL